MMSLVVVLQPDAVFAVVLVHMFMPSWYSNSNKHRHRVSCRRLLLVTCQMDYFHVFIVQAIFKE